MIEYKVVFPGSRKMWTTDLSLIKNYSKLLKEDCFKLYSQATIWVKKDGKTEFFDLDTWLKENDLV